MAIINYKNHPKTTDTITFNLLTPGADGCLSANPYKVDNVKIFFVERGFADSNLQEYDKTVGNTDLEAKYTEAKKLACIDPTEDNILAAQAAKVKAESARVTNSFYYTSAIPVAVFGTPNFPAWLSSDTENAILENVPYDELGNTIYGNFKLTWTPKGGTKEGDYFVCWTWTPFPAGESISDNDYFDLVGDTVATTSIPSHATKEGKYELLLERYLPNIYKTSLCEGDLTSDTIEKLHTAIAGGFTQIENMANQVVDLYNADIVHESMLLLLSNMLGRKLRSEDPTLWRRQAANAISLFKKKGTHKGLSQALDEAGITLNKITKLWQVISPYTFQESFIVDNELDFYLENFPVLPVDGNYELYLRLENEEDYISIAVDNVEFSIVDSVSIMSWIGDQKSVNPISLAKGDELLVKYLIKEIPNGTQQTIENFIVTLPIADQRDTRDQNYPLKNWNVRLIEEDDPLFDIIVPVHTQGGAYHDLLVFGMIRTEFPYSENIYNMDEYNGSKRESNDPCDIDKDFLDPCDSCLSSSIIVDIEIEEISNNRIKEATEVIEEFIPFHTNVFRVNLAGQIEEFMTPPVEELEILVTFRVEEIVLAGNSNSYFHRVRDEGNISTNAITRDALATGVEVLSGVVGIAYNSEIVLYDYNINFKDLGINLNDHILQILAPSLNSGTYTITGINKNSLVVSGVTEPFNTSYFTYQILNKQLTTTNASIVQDDLFTFYDESLNFAQLGIQTIQESANWKIYVPAFSPSPFLVEDILPNGNLILRNHGSLPASSTYDISYTLLTDTDQEVENSTSGTLIVTKRGLVDINDINFQEPVGNVQSRLKFNDLFEVFGNQYPIIEFIDDQQFRIGNYSEGNAGGINAPIYRKLISHNTGIFDYSGMKLQCVGDHEFQFSILNGTNAPIDPDDITESDSFKENYLVVINDESYYKIVEWNGSTITLDGPKETWFTLDSGGTEVNYSLKHFTKNEITVDATTNLLDPPPHRFAFIDRRGNDMVEALLPDQTTSFIALSNTPGASLEETVSQQEGITYTIEYSDGRIVEGIIL